MAGHCADPWIAVEGGAAVAEGEDANLLSSELRAARAALADEERRFVDQATHETCSCSVTFFSNTKSSEILFTVSSYFSVAVIAVHFAQSFLLFNLVLLLFVGYVSCCMLFI